MRTPTDLHRRLSLSTRARAAIPRALASTCIAALAVGLAVPPVAMAEDATFLWRGIKHTWDVDCHYVERIGSWIDQLCIGAGCIGAAYNSGAAYSNVTDDDADYRTAYTTIVADNAGFQNGTRTIAITGTAGTWVGGTETVVVNATPSLQGLDNYVGLLNGFDLIDVAGDSQRFDRLKILIGAVSYDSGSNTLEFDIHWGVRMGIGGTIDYDLQVNYVIAGGDDGAMRYTNDELAITNYSWEDDWEEEPEYFDDHKKLDTITYPGATHPAHAPTAGTVGMRGFNINLDDAFYLNQLVIRVRDISYDAIDFEATYTGDAFFRAVGPSTLPNEAGGTTDMRLYTTLLEFDSAVIDDTLYTSGTYTSPPTEEVSHSLTL